MSLRSGRRDEWVSLGRQLYQRALGAAEGVGRRIERGLKAALEVAEASGLPRRVAQKLAPRTLTASRNDEPSAYDEQVRPSPAASGASNGAGGGNGHAAPSPKEKARPAAAPRALRAALNGESAPGRGPGERAVGGRNVKPGLVGDRSRSRGIRVIEPQDAIKGSTYLARIIWSLGMADLEGIGPLRPADMARMVVARSTITLESPNVARYIRRSRPSSITVARSDGPSKYYRLNQRGQRLFKEHFSLN